MPENQVPKLFSSATESEEAEVVQINGSIPSWVSGSFFRTGPAKWDLDESRFTVSHLLDGFAMISKFQLDPVRQLVTFSKKFLQSDAYRRALAARRPVLTEYGTPSYPDPNKGFFSKWLAASLPIELSDNGFSSIFQIGSDIFATSETCHCWSVNQGTLDTVEKHDANKYYGVNIDSAHPLMDDAGVTWNMGCTFLTGLKYHLVKIPAYQGPASGSAKDLMKKSKIVTTIPSSWNGLMSYNHQGFVLTRNYVVFIEQPFIMNIGKAAKSILRGSPTFSEYLEWRPELRNRFYIIDKSSGKIVSSEVYATEAFFFLHYINAYEENNQIVLDLISYPNADLFKDLYMHRLRSSKPLETHRGSAHRYVIPLGNIKNMSENVNLVDVKSDASVIKCGSTLILRPEVLTQPGIEYPMVNRTWVGKKYKYFYASGSMAETEYRNCITKFDGTNSSSSSSWVGGSTQFPGEVQVVPNPRGKAEDDVILISAVTDSRYEVNDFLVFIDAKTMTEVGRAQFKSGVPAAMHGLYLEQKL